MLAEESGEYKNIKHMRVEADDPHVQSPQELYDSIKDVNPITSDILRAATASEMMPGKSSYGVYKILQLKELKANGIWKWDNLISFRNAMDRKAPDA